MSVSANRSRLGTPAPSAVLELLKPVTWFPPMWAYLCGIVSSGLPADGRWSEIILGVLLAGPLVCAMSQAANDWCDRHVDAINQPERPVPSGRLPGRWGLWIALFWTALSLAVGAALGPWGLAATVFAVICAWIYSAEPIRLKRNGWWGNGAVGLCYEGVPWFTGAAIMAAALPRAEVIVIALLYAAGAHGIMTLNDFKSIDGDRQMGLGSLPAKLGPARAARLACWVMALPQVVVIGLLVHWDQPWHALAIGAVLCAQLLLMRRLLADPRGRAPWYNATGISLYVLGMLAAAFALGAMTGAGVP
ncbi:MAG: chlorophyll synthase ChlG [Pseudomonadota bacterium]